ncbi:MAG: DUF2167 domain-containing protein [Burkholderiaceae bacterium]|nr:DUF2167 domain-containing protein [Burkholderiaceae bacterium]
MKQAIKALVLGAALLITGAARAQSAPAADAQQQARAQVWAEARKAAQDGPQDVALAQQAALKLPAGYSFIPQPHATQLLNAMGNPGQDERLQGLIFPQGDAGWFMTVRYEAAGYIKDDDAKDWKADELLQSYREGTAESNKEREKLGMPALEILGWAETPKYDSATHRLAWAMSSRQKGSTAQDEQGVNYNTYVLGREGFFSMNLVTGLKELPEHKPAATTLLNALNFDAGKTYADFNAATDKVAEYGLAALVVGVAAKKLGLIALVLAFVAKFAKIIFIAVVAFGGVLMKFLGRRKAASAAAGDAEAKT